MPYPKQCETCKTRECESQSKRELDVCSYGYNFERVDPEFVVFGIAVREFATNSPARQKRLREAATDIVPRDKLQTAVEAYQAFSSKITSEIDEQKQRLMQDYVNTARFRGEFLREVRSNIEQGLALFHDYKQINKQISQNINVLIETTSNGADFKQKVANAKPAERAIYESSKILGEKLNIARVLLRPEWLKERENCGKFRFHGMASRYLHIYNSTIHRKDLRAHQIGESRAEIYANDEAVSIIPHTLLDNAVKYSANGGEITMEMNDREGFIDFAVTSWGPLIKKSEEGKIFNPFYRGEAAIKMTGVEGSGYGLFVAQMVAEVHLGTHIEVDQ